MAEKSIFLGGDGMTRGGLDRYLGPEARDTSSLPAATGNPEDDAAAADPNATNSDPVLNEIAAAEKTHEAGRKH